MFSRADLPNGVSLRAAQPGDAEFERTLYRARRWDLWLVEGEDEFIHTLIDQQYRAQVQGYIAQFPQALYYVIEKTGMPCGRLVLDVSQDVRVVDIALLPEAQGASIGTTVLQAMQRVAAEIPAPVSLSVHCLNTAAIRTYRQLGFEPTAADVGALHIALEWRPASLRESKTAFAEDALGGHTDPRDPGGDWPS